MLMIFGMALYEAYYVKNQKLPWFFGLEDDLAKYDHFGPAAFFLLCGIVAATLAFWLLPKFSKWWNEKKYMPGSITKMSLCGLGLVLLIFTMGNFSSSVCRTYGYTWGTNAVSLGGNTMADVAEIAQSENDKQQEEMDAMRAKTKRLAPEGKHRHTNSGTNGK
ncbi:MAG: hypothetical protein AAB424_04010 [Patescibacteria group bacterium]